MTSQRAARFKRGVLGVFVDCFTDTFPVEGGNEGIFPLSDILSVNL